MQPWTPGTPIASLPGSIPTTPLPPSPSLTSLPSLLTTYLTALSPSHLTSSALWLDYLAKTSSIRTHSHSIPTTFALTPTHNIRTQPARIVRLATTSWVSVPFTFTTRHPGALTAQCSGVAYLTLEGADADAEWKIFSLSTILESFLGHPSPDVPPPPPPTPTPSSTSPEKLPQCEQAPGTSADPKAGGSNYHVIIVGGGQNGLCLAGRLAALGISYVVLEKEEVGYRWVSRYDSVRQHTVRGLNVLPFGETWEDGEEEFLHGEKVMRGFGRWVRRWGIKVWEGCEVKGCERDGEGWRVSVLRKDGDGEAVLKGKHVAFALGGGLSVARWPEVVGRDRGVFRGRVMHTTEFKNSKGWKGKAVVVGTGTAAHDIAQDLYENGLDVTMVQRGKTAVYPIDWYAGNQRSVLRMKLGSEAMDRLLFGVPIKVAGEMQRRSYDGYVDKHRNFFQGLETAGFRTGLGDGVDRTPDEIVYNHFGGYYIDIGTSKLIIERKIRIVNGSVDRLSNDGLVVGGKEVKADHIVFATGQESDYRKDLEPILPIARSLPPVWGLTEEGDPRGMMEQVGPGLWLVMGSAAHARWYSRFIALQIQEEMLRKDSKI